MKASLHTSLKDTTDFLNKLNTIGQLRPGTILCTLDVSSLYTNIPHVDGIQVCFEALETRTRKSPPTQDLCDLLELTLKSNNFTFNEEHYQQISGTLMGGRYALPYALPYATIFMGWLEHTLLSTAPIKPQIWLRFIDDIFIIWTHTEKELSNFIDHANRIHPSIKFTSEHSNTDIAFLDVRVKIIDNIIQTDLYTKPTDKHLYRQPSSCHPKHITRNIPYSLAVRLRRICSEDTDLESQTKELTQQLKDRGYKTKNITDQITRAKQTPRSSTLIKAQSHRRQLATQPLPNCIRPPFFSSKSAAVLFKLAQFTFVIPTRDDQG